MEEPVLDHVLILSRAANLAVQYRVKAPLVLDILTNDRSGCAPQEQQSSRPRALSFCSSKCAEFLDVLLKYTSIFCNVAWPCSTVTALRSLR